jgi:hypothetical protein
MGKAMEALGIDKDTIAKGVGNAVLSSLGV